MGHSIFHPHFLGFLVISDGYNGEKKSPWHAYTNPAEGLFDVFQGPLVTKNTSFSPAQGFFSPLLSTPKFPPSYLPHFLLIPSSQSFEETWNTRLEEGGELKVEGMWSGKSKRSTSSQMQKWERKVSSLLSLHFFSFLRLFSSAWQDKYAKEKALETKR